MVHPALVIREPFGLNPSERLVHPLGHSASFAGHADLMPPTCTAQAVPDLLQSLWPVPQAPRRNAPAPVLVRRPS
jgi:hypothetical protein